MNQANSDTQRPIAKGYGKIWTKTDIDLMIQLELRLTGHPRIAKEMGTHFPGKTIKQIRDKRKEASYKKLLQSHLDGPTEDVNPPLGLGEETYIDLSGADSTTGSGPNPQMEESRGEEPRDMSEEITRSIPTPMADIEAQGPAVLHTPNANWISQITDQVLEKAPNHDTADESHRALYAHLTSVLQDARENRGVITQGLIDEIYTETKLLILKESHPKERTRPRPSRRADGHKKRKHKRYLYARTQDLYKRNPSTLAKYIREDVNWLSDEGVEVSQEDISLFYTNLWGTAPDINLPFDTRTMADETIDILEFSAITVQEIQARINRLKKDTAAGPDHIEKRHITSQHAKEAMRLMFNIILISGTLPSAWGTNRTVLIPKQGKDTRNIENYRPITIGSILSRIYWGIIDNRLRERTTFSPRQKGFVNEAGCFNNVHILNEILRAAKLNSGITVIQLDISKAFDTVPHKAIPPALKRLGVPAEIISSISASYEHITTNICHKGSKAEINLQRGVKQGDPLSPYIFNAIMDPLIEQLETLQGYHIDASNTISTLAFADDILLLADNRDKAHKLLHHTETYLKQLGMQIAPTKCTSFEIKTSRGTWYIADPDIRLGTNIRIPATPANGTLTYLGGRISPWFGLQHSDLENKLRATLRRLGSTLLKPHQKLMLLSTYIIPHFLHATTLTTPPITTIRGLDSIVRTYVKEFLHLPSCTPNGLLYCSKRDGGLGIPKFEILSVTTALKQGITLLNTLDPAAQALFRLTLLEKRLEKMAKSARLLWPIQNFRSIDAYKQRLKKAELEQWSKLPSKGKSVLSFANDRYGNEWLYNPELLKPCRFITALRMRSGTTSDRVTISKAIPQSSVTCRRCKSSLETLAHIVGQCINTKPQRIRRHNDIRDFVSKKLASNTDKFQIIEEASVETPTGALKPDLAVISQGRVHVVDVTVRHEDMGYLEGGHRSKVEKYKPLLPILAEQLQVTPGTVLPIVVGTRGAMPKATIASLSDLGISDRSSLITISLLALRSSIEMYLAFLDYDAPGR